MACEHMIDGRYCGLTLGGYGPEMIPVGPTSCNGKRQFDEGCLFYRHKDAIRFPNGAPKAKNWVPADPFDVRRIVGKEITRISITDRGVIGHIGSFMFVCTDFENPVCTSKEPLHPSEANASDLYGPITWANRMNGITIASNSHTWVLCTHADMVRKAPKVIPAAKYHKLVGKHMNRVRAWGNGVYGYIGKRCFVCTDFENPVHTSPGARPVSEALPKLSMFHEAPVTQALDSDRTYLVLAGYRWTECEPVAMHTPKEVAEGMLDSKPDPVPDVFDSPATIMMSAAIARANECRACQRDEARQCCDPAHPCEIYTIRQKAHELSKLVEPDPCEFCVRHDTCAQQLRMGYGFYPEDDVQEAISVRTRIEDDWDAEDIEAGTAQEYGFFECHVEHIIINA